MSSEYDFDEDKFKTYLPRLCKDKRVRKEITQYSEDKKLIGALKKFTSLDGLESELAQTLYAEVRDAYFNLSDSVFSLGWDGNAPGCSGVVWINELCGIYSICSSDYGPYGPFESLDEALNFDTFGCTATPDLSSSAMCHEELIAFAKSSVVPMDWEDFEVWINGRLYKVEGAELVEINT